MIEFYGGDLQGVVEQQLDYLTDLGVNALYLNPIFTAYTNHRYDVVDYDNVDPHLGGNAALAELRRAATDRGMRYILDIVPNHCGLFHPWFRAAQADPNAADDRILHLPPPPGRLRVLAGGAQPAEAQLSERRGCARPSTPGRTPSSGVGCGLPTAPMAGAWMWPTCSAARAPSRLGAEVARGIRRAVKAENPDAYLLGENFFDGTAQLQGDGWDATMNYAGFTHAALVLAGRLLRRTAQRAATR